MTHEAFTDKARAGKGRPIKRKAPNKFGGNVLRVRCTSTIPKQDQLVALRSAEIRSSMTFAIVDTISRTQEELLHRDRCLDRPLIRAAQIVIAVSRSSLLEITIGLNNAFSGGNG